MATDKSIVRPIPFKDALSERYLAYALSTITARSLPDVRDGLKPVQRRLLYAMMKLKLDPETGYKKCARVVGDVIGKYHPHGDTSIYDAMVRLAQEFAQRYPLVDGQGNFGNIDGDNAAAMRYTEARMTEVAKALLQGIDQDTVDFRPTYETKSPSSSPPPSRTCSPTALPESRLVWQPASRPIMRVSCARRFVSWSKSPRLLWTPFSTMSGAQTCRPVACW